MSSPRAFVVCWVFLVVPVAVAQSENVRVKLTGTLTDPEGKPVENAKVTGGFARGKSSSGLYTATGGLNTKTDAKGEFALNLLSGDAVFMHFYAENLVAEPFFMLEIKTEPRTVRIDRQMEPGKRIAGRITWGPDDKPYARNMLTLFHVGGSIPVGMRHVRGYPVRTVSTTEDGSYEMYVPPGRYLLRTNTDRSGIKREKQLEVASDSSETIINFHSRLSKSDKLECKVVDPDGKPVPDIDVFYGQRYSVRTDAEGVAHYKNRGLSTNMFFVSVMGKKRPKITDTPLGAARLIAPETENITLTLKKPITVRGRLFDIDTEQPFAGDNVLHQLGTWENENRADFNLMELWDPIQIDSEGRFEIRNVLQGGLYRILLQRVVHEKDASTGKTRKVRTYRFLGMTTPFRDTDIDLGDLYVGPPRNGWPISTKRFEPESPEQFAERLGTAIETAALQGKRVLLFFSDLDAKHIDPNAENREVCWFYQFELTDYVENLLFKDIFDRYELVAHEVRDFANPPEEITFITEQLGIDLPAEEKGVLCILDDTGKCLQKRSLAELARPDNPGVIDPAILYEFLTAP